MACTYLVNQNGDRIPLESFYHFYYSSVYDDLIRSNGCFQKFKIGDEVPIKTDWYQYPENCNFLFTFVNKPVVVQIRNGILEAIKDLKKTRKDDYSVKNYDEYGNSLKIYSYEDADFYFDLKLDGSKIDYFQVNKTEFEKTLEKLNAYQSIINEMFDRFLQSGNPEFKNICFKLKNRIENY